MPLFGQKPVPTAHIVKGAAEPLSKEQKSFNSLISKIEQRRAQLREWEASLMIFRQKFTSELLPLHEQQLDLQHEFAKALDAAHDRKGLTKREKFKLGKLILNLAETVLADEENEECKALFNKYSESDFDTEEEAMLNGMKNLLEGMLGMDLGDDVDMRSPEDFMKRVETQFRAQQEEQEAQEAAAPPRKKTRRQEAQEAKREADEKQLSQSIQEVFRKLASALHPDREPDPAEKERKTALMQRANQAYEKGNLLQLLELQLELEQIDQAHLASIRPERLKHYVKILKGQLDDLEREIQYLELGFKQEYGIHHYRAIRPENLLPILHQDMVICQRQIDKLRQQLGITADLKQLKAWLKKQVVTEDQYSAYDMPF